MSPTGKNSRTAARHRRDAGFTLVEMMVVIVVIGLMSSLVLLNLPGRERTVHDEAERLAARLDLAGREAIARGGTVGVLMTREGYRFLQHRRGSWEAIELIPGQQDIAWPEDTEVMLSLSGERLTLPRRAGLASVTVPFLFFTPTSESVPFDLTLHRRGEMASVRGDGVGRIVVER